MKVLVVSNMYPDRNPACSYQGIFVKEQVDSLNSRQGVKCDIFIIDGFKSKLNYLKRAITLYRLLEKHKYDVVHVHYGLAGLFMLLNPFKNIWKNVVLTLHGGDILSKQGKYVQVALSKMVAKRAGKLITLNNEMNSVVSKLRNDFQVLPCGVDDKLFHGLYSSERKNQILFPGSKFRPEKNHKLFSDIMRCYQDLFGEVELMELDGYSRGEISLLLRESKALLMTSTSEGSSQVIKEAMLSDLAVVSSNVGDVEYILGGTSGTAIFDNNEPIKIAKLLHKTINEAKVTQSLRRNRILHLGLDQDNITDKLIELYKSGIKE
jgi:glycosyltransferase involved in cell wall biosynthesis